MYNNFAQNRKRQYLGKEKMHLHVGQMPQNINIYSLFYNN